MSSFQILEKIRAGRSRETTPGLQDDVIRRFLEHDTNLQVAIDQAGEIYEQLCKEFPELMKLDSERELFKKAQEGYLNFYPADSVSPYLPLSAKGPWIISSHGAVIYDTGGYGMLGLGHSPTEIINKMAEDHVMANIMTPSISHKRFMESLRSSIGTTRKGGCPYSHFVCMNSGSESVTVGLRIADINARIMTDPGGKHEGKKIMLLALDHAFHGRTDRPAQASHSTYKKYQKLASFRDRQNLLTTMPNDLDGLRAVFEKADKEGVFIEAFLMEPVMGEGNPGMAITPEFYALARKLTKEHGSLLLIDAIQASLRTYGVLSIVDNPGFGNLESPDLETYSKALNAGQYPLSVLALTERAAKLYSTGLYGNTMTTNPRALEVGKAVLDAFDDALRVNIVGKGDEFLQKLEAIRDELPDVITQVQGTGLLLSAELVPELKVTGFGGVEEHMRQHGVNVIHGGTNSLRFTPWFKISSEEIDLIISVMRSAIEANIGNERAATDDGVALPA